MSNEFTPENFILAIRDKAKIRAERLIQLISMKAEIEDTSENRLKQIENKLAELN